MYIMSFEELLNKTKKISVEFTIRRVKQKSLQIGLLQSRYFEYC